MANRMANRMAKPVRFRWQKDAPNPNPNPNPKTNHLGFRSSGLNNLKRQALSYVTREASDDLTLVEATRA